MTRVNHPQLQCNFSASKIATFRTCSKLNATWRQFFRKMWQKGISAEYQGVIFPRGQLFTSFLGAPYQAWALLKKEKSCVEQFGVNKHKNKTKKIIATHYVTSPLTQCYITIVFTSHVGMLCCKRCCSKLPRFI